MNRSVYIAIFLSGLLLAPSLYKSIHVAQYHSNDDGACAHHCAAEHPDTHPADSHSADDHPADDQNATHGHDGAPCPVLDFDLYAATLATLTYLPSISASPVIHFESSLASFIPEALPGIVIPRGPPALHSI